MASLLTCVRCPHCGHDLENGALKSTPENGGVGITSSPVLHSWKEIAAYVACGVRTVQRWEHEHGLPVRRVGERKRTAIMAFPDEIDAWLRRAPASQA